MIYSAAKTQVTPTRQRPRSRWFRAFGLAALLVVIGALGRSSSAEFEVPAINPANAPPNVEFRGVWAFDRGTYIDSATQFDRYEAFAVGVNAASADTATNGVLFYFDGQQWSYVDLPFTTSNVFSLNAVTGRQSSTTGTLDGLWAVGAGGQIFGFTGVYNGIIGGVNNKLSNITYTDSSTNNFYAIDVASEPGSSFLAGGQAGLLVTNAGTVHRITDATNITTNVTGIKFVDKDTVYATTTTLASGTPFDHNCTGSHTGKLYVKTGFSGNPNGSWTTLRTDTNNCFYGLTAVRNSEGNPVIWIASEKGLFRYDTATGAWTQAKNPDNSLNTKPYYSVSAVSRRSGTGVNLLNNGNFENSTNYRGWTLTDTSGISTITPGGAGDNGQYIRVVGQAPLGNSIAAYQTIPLTTIEGQRFKISGDYQVTFSGSQAYSQGGVVLACAGSNVATSPDYVNCSVSNRKNVRVQDSTTNGPTTGWTPFEMIVSREDGIFSSIQRANSTTPYVTKRKMDLQIRCEATYGATVSCDNLKVEMLDEPPVPGQDNVLVIAAGKDLATNGIAVTEGGLNTSMILQTEAIPAGVRDSVNLTKVNAMYAVGAQHIYAVGMAKDGTGVTTGLTIFSRTPSTLNGTIWAGATQASGGATVSPLGKISASCADADTDESGTLCQRSPESYGISLEITSAPNTTKVGQLTGRGWFGKTADTQESLDLGSCIGSPSEAMNWAAMNASAGTNICDLATRRCKAVDSDGSYIVGSLTGTSCLSNFDCLGRCEQDQGFVCIIDDDCRLGNDSNIDTTWAQQLPALSSPIPNGPAVFSAQPATRLKCAYQSSLACSSLGWLSFNAADFPGDTTPPVSGHSFGVTYNTLYTGCNTTISPINKCRGDASVICATDNDCLLLGGDHNKNYTANNNKGAHELSGWARFMTLAKGVCDNDPTGTISCVDDSVCGTGHCVNSSDKNSPLSGWVHFRSEAETLGQGKLFGCRNCDGSAVYPNSTMNCAFCRDSGGQSCVPSSLGSESKCYNVCKGNTALKCSATVDCETQQAESGPCITPGYCSNDSTQFCENDTTCGSGKCIIGSVCETTGSRCSKYGVNLDTDTGTLTGSAWSQDFGWLDFSGVSYGGGRIIQTKLGDIYATGQIGETGLVESSSCNSTYLITSASDIRNFCSALSKVAGSTESGLQPEAAQIPIISTQNSYQNVLGRFDVKGMETVISGGKNKYGTDVVSLAPTTPLRIDDVWTTAMPGTPKTLGGKVYVVGDGSSTYTIDQDMLFANGTYGPPIVSGAGTLIVNGSLTINANLSYGTTPLDDLRQLASLTIVVKGSLTIATNVKDLVGAYYVTETIATSNTSSGNQNPLTVYGLMIAKTFEFKRNFAGTIADPRPSELVIYDGRLQSNPMLGMVDFASAMPNPVQ